jgi:hypothetical protein
VECQAKIIVECQARMQCRDKVKKRKKRLLVDLF